MCCSPSRHPLMASSQHRFYRRPDRSTLHQGLSLISTTLLLPAYKLMSCCYVLQPQQAFSAGITNAQEVLPPRPPYIASEAAEGVAYSALPSPKAAVLTPVTETVKALYNQISTVKPCCLCLQGCVQTDLCSGALPLSSSRLSVT